MASIINASNSGFGGIVSTGDSSGELKLQTAGTTALTIDTSQNVSLTGTLAMSSSFLRNRIINGDMRIDQRNAGASVTPTVTNTYTLDRWNEELSQASKFSIQQNAGSVTPPAGFTNYLGVTSLSSYSILSTDFFTIEQRIEGYNVADLAWGTANAKTITLSFWVRSSLTGTFGGALSNSAYNRSYPFTYTISTANTWTQISVTIAGDTSGTWLTTNGIGMYVFFGLGAGSTQSQTAGAWVGVGCVSATGATSVVGTNGATWFITGVQLEVGSTATPFERRLYNQELANCQRYFQVIGGVNGGFPMATSYFSAGSQTARFPISFPVVTRATPTVTKNGTWDGNASQPSAGYISSAGFAMELNSSASGMQYSFPNSTDDTFTIAAEI